MTRKALRGLYLKRAHYRCNPCIAKVRLVPLEAAFLIMSSSTRITIRGTYTAIVTPFRDRIDEKAFTQLFGR